MATKRQATIKVALKSADMVTGLKAGDRYLVSDGKAMLPARLFSLPADAKGRTDRQEVFGRFCENAPKLFQASQDRFDSAPRLPIVLTRFMFTIFDRLSNTEADVRIGHVDGKLVAINRETAEACIDAGFEFFTDGQLLAPLFVVGATSSTKVHGPTTATDYLAGIVMPVTTGKMGEEIAELAERLRQAETPTL